MIGLGKRNPLYMNNCVLFCEEAVMFNHLHTYIFIYKDIFDEGAADSIEKSGASGGKVF